MFHLTRKLFTALPLAWFGLGLMQNPWLIPLPSALMLAFLIGRYRRILTLIGTAPLASDGFAKHLLVDDLLRLAGLSLLGPLLFMAGGLLAGA